MTMHSTSKWTDWRKRNARLGSAAAVLGVVLSVAGLAGSATLAILEGGEFELMVVHFHPQFAVIGIGFGLLARVVLPREPENTVLWVYAIVALLSGLFLVGEVLGFVEVRSMGLPLTEETINDLRPADFSFGGAVVVMVSAMAVSPGIFWVLSLGIILFPDGRLPSTRWRWVVWLAVVSALAASAILGYLERPSGTVTYGEIENTNRYDDVIGGPLVGLIVATIMSFAGLLVRFLRSSGVERQQIRWVLFGSALTATGLVVAVILSTSGNSLAVSLGVLTPLLIFMGCFWLALTRYRLYDIDIVISRTFVFGALAVFIGVVYIAVVVGLGAAFGGGDEANPVLAILATAFIAVAFQPLRARLQRVANRIVFGRRATPYEVLSEFSRQVAAADVSLVDSVARSLAEGTAAQSAEVWVLREGKLQRLSAWPESTEISVATVGDTKEVSISGADLVAPIIEGEELLGAIALTTAPGQELSEQDRELTEELTSGVGLALRNSALTASLQRSVGELRESRRRVVALQDETRRSLERDLHDGAQQRLVALKVKLGLAGQVAKRDGAEKTREFLRGLSEQADEAIAELRSFARGIYPPLLEAEGLVAALKSEASRSVLTVDIAANDVGRYPKALESTVYFCVLEALQNVALHSGAAAAQVSLVEREGSLVFEVRDAGSGYDSPATKPGRGITNMVDRLDAAEGTLTIETRPGEGTTVRGIIPLAGGAG